MVVARFPSRNDRDQYSLVLGAAKDDLRCKASAKADVSREGQISKTFQYRGLPAALIADHDELRQADVVSYIARKELVDLLKKLATSEACAAIANLALLPRRTCLGLRAWQWRHQVVFDLVGYHYHFCLR